MRLAVDVNVSNREIGELTREWHTVVCVAERSEDDESWLSRALEFDADVVVSQDLDVPNILDRWKIVDVYWFENLMQFRAWLKKGRKK